MLLFGDIDFGINIYVLNQINKKEKKILFKTINIILLKIMEGEAHKYKLWSLKPSLFLFLLWGLEKSMNTTTTNKVKH